MPTHLVRSLLLLCACCLGLPLAHAQDVKPPHNAPLTQPLMSSSINDFDPGLLRAVLGRAEDGTVERKGGVMGVVVTGGIVRAGDAVRVELPEGALQPLAPV